MTEPGFDRLIENRADLDSHRYRWGTKGSTLGIEIRI
jgi:hypothetical protein